MNNTHVVRNTYKLRTCHDADMTRRAAVTNIKNTTGQPLKKERVSCNRGVLVEMNGKQQRYYFQQKKKRKKTEKKIYVEGGRK